jgi:hypothetical protein
MKTTVSILFIFLTLSCGRQQNSREYHMAASKTSEKIWRIISTNEWLKHEGLLNVESIIYDDSNEVFYATNGLDYRVGTNGFISKISDEGILQELKWIVGLNRPTGMAIKDSLLYVADVNSLVVINTKKGNVVKRFLEPIQNSGLNDVAIDYGGEVYVSASFIHAVFKLRNDSLELWTRDDKEFQWANGLIANSSEIVVAGLGLCKIDINSKVITQIKLESEMQDFDGIVPDGAGGFFMTTVENSALYHLNEKMFATKLMEADIYFGDLEFLPSSGKIYIPRGDRKTSEFFITVITMQRH